MVAETTRDALAADGRDALRELEPYLREGFAEVWRRWGATLGYSRLAWALRFAEPSAPELAPSVEHVPSRTHRNGRNGARPTDRALRPVQGFQELLQRARGERDKPLELWTWDAERACHLSYYIDNAGRRHGLKAHRCLAACRWTHAEAREYLQVQRIFVDGRSYVPALLAKAAPVRALDQKIAAGEPL